MKKLIFILLCMIFLIGIISAADWDNIKSYEEETKTITLYNWNIIGKLFNIRLADYKLTYNTDQCLIDCYAEGTAILYTDEQLFRNLKFQDKLEKLTSIKSSKIFVEVNESYEIEVIDYKEVCEDKISVNGTSKVCYQKQIGSHKETRYKIYWKEYNGEILKEGIYKWKIEGQKSPSQSVDWIGNAFGKDLDEWTWWDSSWTAKKEIKIQENTGNNWVNYSVYLNVTYDNDMQSDFDDLRFTESTETSELKYYIETKTNSNSAQVWVKTGLTANVNTSIYMYYKNVGVATTSNRTTAFLWDDDGSKDRTAEYTTVGPVAIWNWTGGEYNFQGTDTDAGNVIYPIGLNCSNCSVYGEIKDTATAFYVAGITLREQATNNDYKIQKVNANLDAREDAVSKGAVGTGTNNVYFNATVWAFGTTINWSGQGATSGSIQQTDTTYSSGYAGWWNYDDGLMKMKQLRIRAYGSPEPTASFGAEETTNALAVTLNSPVAAYNTSNPSITFNCSATDETGVLNLTLIINDGDNETMTGGTGLNLSLQTTKNMNDGNHNWTCRASDGTGAGDPVTASARNLMVDTIAPSINVSYPVGTITFYKKNTNLSLNWTVTDINLDSCWYNWDGTNNTLTCGANSTSFNVTDGTNKDLNFYANDTFGHEANQTVTWDYRLFLEREIFDSKILEGSQSTFTADFLTNTLITIAKLNHNSTSNIGTIFDHGNNNFTINKTIIIPSVSSDTNMSFYWNITQGSLNFALEPKNQTVLNLGIDNCSVNSNVLYNFTIVDEETQTNLSGSGNNTQVKIDLQIYGFGTTTIIEQFNKSYSQINPFAVCLSNNLSSGEKYNINVQVQYDADNYEQELYHIQREVINSSSFPTNIKLYDLKSSNSQVFKIMFKSSTFLPVEDALIKIYRKYVDEGTFKIVEIPKTDKRGEAVAHLVLNDVIYNFVIIKNGEILATFNNVMAVCQTPLISPCRIDFNAYSQTIEVPDFEEAENFLFTLGFNSTSRNIVSVFSIPSGEPSEVKIEVIKEDALGTSVCSDTLTSASGTLTCNVGNNFGNATVLAKLYKDGKLQSQGQIKINQIPSDIYGAVLIILAIFIITTLIGAGLSDNPIYTTIFLMLGVILLFAMNLVSNKGFIGATATILWLFVAVVLLLIKGVKRN